MLDNLGDDYGHDGIRNLIDAEEDDREASEAAASQSDGENAVAADCESESASSSENETAVAAGSEGPLKNDAATDQMEDAIVPLEGVRQSSKKVRPPGRTDYTVQRQFLGWRFQHVIDASRC